MMFVASGNVANASGVNRAFEAYDKLSVAQKAKIPKADEEKLDLLVAKMSDLQTTSIVEESIRALPAVEDLSLGDKDAIKATAV